MLDISFLQLFLNRDVMEKKQSTVMEEYNDVSNDKSFVDRFLEELGTSLVSISEEYVEFLTMANMMYY